MPNLLTAGQCSRTCALDNMIQTYIYTKNTIQSRSDKLRVKQQQLPKAGCREIGCLVPTGQISNMYHKYTAWTEFVLVCSCSITMNYFLFVRVLHEYQYYIQMNVNIMGELAYFDSRCRELWGDAFEPWIFERWGSDSLTIHSLDHTNDKRQPSREIQPHSDTRRRLFTCSSEHVFPTFLNASGAHWFDPWRGLQVRLKHFKCTHGVTKYSQ